MEPIGVIAERVRIEIYHEFAKSGVEISRCELAAKTNLQLNLIDRAYKHLAIERHIVLDENGKVIMAHPFATVNLGFSVPVSHTWDDVVHTCSNQRIFCNQQCITQWLNRTGNSLGYCMNLTTLWNLAKNWYSGRLDTPYKRREPNQAAEYFKSVGLKGPFWGS
ncbi:alkylmercury lyase domain-containing protein [Ditylenchus destructor]|uniref:Alkylmercury lyase domain-containing protein n=1 Tax=Ditylenchus destructor TaxID=166010 RepID=A0AAD4RE46_9BILA|nr:alkylmercury lyase domain-containing protein [Ditylenchus destructor]